jgi:hypothetical protein
MEIINQKNLRAFAYALSLAIGVVFVQIIGTQYPIQHYIGFSGILHGVLIIEVFLNYRKSVQVIKQLDLPEVKIYNRFTQAVFHWLVPISFLVVLLTFIYLNNQSSLILFFFALSFAFFFLFFVNMRAYYEDKFKLEAKTHFIYDVMKIFTFFALVNSILNISTGFEINFFITVALVSIAAIILTLSMLLVERRVGIVTWALIFLAGMALGYLTSSLQLFLDGTNLIISFYSALVFYIFNALIYHEIKRTLNRQIIVEYLLVAAICLLTLLLLS